ncbi:MAG: Sialic acid TRAP transporter permease protein SiaT [Deltaproteobacteria bacterium ADurb.Bin151]|jgi:C4-dicarboxylate transporter, DctM subunit|nr:MAG: Sialic acid TRAP transporter permease protein SiaT [Deltaproteobacteria bacterium ADurb.Bin151]HNZ10876.1 TRAP transporter large permease [Smithellaceae bacterium]HOG81737.1 TRAP transporter large permease [Smithellaceae bacterium]HOQ41954.1 TRAP transporter large permease [Smithellaceae bacterium]HPL66613.1 TRAP transporter large permease [Smithellaceae bacterium]
MTPTMIGLIGFAALIILMFLHVPVGFVMALVGYLGFGYIVSWSAASNLLIRDFYSTFSAYNLTVIPLFVLMGQVAFHSGISRRLFNAAHKFFGHLPGGLAVATIGACAGFSAVCGSTSATAATMASVALPEMKKYKYDPALATGVVTAGGSLGILIPPSTIFIIYGIMTEQSIGELFMAGVIPGILLSCFFVLSILIWTFFRPEIGPRGPKSTWSEKIKSLSGLIETLLLFILVMGGLFAGFFTPTEAAGVGAFGTIIIALVGRNLTWKGFVNALYDTTRISCMIFVVVAGATVFGHFLAVTRIPADIGTFVSGLQLHPMIIMGFIILIYLCLGCLMDSLAMIMLTIPIIYPVILSMNFDPIWFGVIIVIVAEMGVITPPVGINAYVVAGVARDVPLHVVFKGSLHMLYAMIALAVLLLIFPNIVTFLPQMLK